MTDTEKILTILEINSNVPSVVVDDDSMVVCFNDKWTELIGKTEHGKSLFGIFDKSTGSLLKNCILDGQTFNKIQRRKLKIETRESIIERQLLLSPFGFQKKNFYIIFLYGDSTPDELIIYPTYDDQDIKEKYFEILNQLNIDIPTTLIERKNFQFNLDAVDNSLAVGDRDQILFINKTLSKLNSLSDPSKQKLTSRDLFESKYFEKIQLAENESFLTKSLFAVEKLSYTLSEVDKGERLLIYPNIDDSGDVTSLCYFGSIKSSEIEDDSAESIPAEKIEENESVIEDQEINDEVQIIYDRNNFEILDLNKAASDFYGYTVDSMRNMNITQLYPPEDMQQLLESPENNINKIGRQILSDGSLVDVTIEREFIVWEGKEACIEKVKLNRTEEEVIPLDEYSKEEDAITDSESVEIQKSERKSDLLSSLFHELLTPVNVILGFVQEIIDSIETPTEEQEESAQIIKDNQQTLLQIMNTAVQYAQLKEGKIKVTPEKFDIQNCILDLKDTFSQISENTKIDVLFNDSVDSVTINHDRSKILAAISYLVKFSSKLTSSQKLFVSMKSVEDEFYVILKDSESGISSKLQSGLIDILKSNKHSGRNDYGISPIAIKLVKELYHLLSLNIVEYSESENIDTLVLVIPQNFQKTLKTAKVDETSMDKKSLSEDISYDSVEVAVEENIRTEADHIEEHDKLPDKSMLQMGNGDIDNKIIEDIEEEEEIVTEEIATLEKEENISTKLSNYSCLFIDDNLDTQLLFKSQMKDFKLLKVCSNLTEALPLLKKYNFDLVIVDVNLNDTYNGFDALKIIRQFKNYSSTPIIAVTAYSFEGDKQKFLNFGFTDYFIKPLLRKQLLTSLEQIL